MSVLDSPLEALAFNHLNFGFLAAVNSTWSWIAVIAGIVSFFLSIRKSAVPGVATQLTEPELSSLERFPEAIQTSKPILDTSEKAAAYPEAEPSSPPSPAWAVETTAAATKGKFTVYYEDDVAAEEEEEEEDCVRCPGCAAETGGGGARRWDWELEGTLKARILTGEEMGWYGYQDLTAIDGNVVRLWDSCRQRSSFSYSAGGFVTASW